MPALDAIHAYQPRPQRLQRPPNAAPATHGAPANFDPHKAAPLGQAPLAPPPLARQNASRLAWPPDSERNWTYIQLNPRQLMQALHRIGHTEVILTHVCQFFATQSELGEHRAFVDYHRRWESMITDHLCFGEMYSASL